MKPLHYIVVNTCIYILVHARSNVHHLIHRFTIISIIRLTTLVSFARSVNVTWDSWSISLWSAMEMHTGIVCICLPSMRIILVRLFPRLRDANSASCNDQTRCQPPARDLSIWTTGTTTRISVDAAHGALSTCHCDGQTEEDCPRRGRDEERGIPSFLSEDVKGILCEMSYTIEYDKQQEPELPMDRLETADSSRSARTGCTES